MATKRVDPIIRAVSAAPAELGAAKLTIPRRELLTGTALVLVASASGCVKGAPPAVAPAITNAAKMKLLRTQFVADFTAAFIGDPTKIKDPGPRIRRTLGRIRAAFGQPPDRKRLTSLPTMQRS